VVVVAQHGSISIPPLLGQCPRPARCLRLAKADCSSAASRRVIRAWWGTTGVTGCQATVRRFASPGPAWRRAEHRRCFSMAPPADSRRERSPAGMGAFLAAGPVHPCCPGRDRQTATGLGQGGPACTGSYRSTSARSVAMATATRTARDPFEATSLACSNRSTAYWTQGACCRRRRSEPLCAIGARSRPLITQTAPAGHHPPDFGGGSRCTVAPQVPGTGLSSMRGYRRRSGHQQRTRSNVITAGPKQRHGEYTSRERSSTRW